MSDSLFDSMNCNPPDSGPWDFPGKDAGVGCHFLLQGIDLTQESNSHLLYLRQILYHSATREAQTCLSITSSI